MHRKLNIRAFTLIELLVVVAIIALLVAILVPSLAGAKRRARTVICAGNLRSLGLATNMYLDENNGFFFPYHVESATSDPARPGMLWWFGLEADYHHPASPRLLDKSLSPIARYTANLDQKIQCPDFPFDDPAFFNKFTQHGATYGYNAILAPLQLNAPTLSRNRCVNRWSGVFLFADGIQFESQSFFNEGFYIQYNANIASPTVGLDGYAHFRHAGRAQIVFLDGHVDSQTLAGPSFRSVAGAAAGNLVPSTGQVSIYGGDMIGRP